MPLRAILFGAALVPAIASQRLAADTPRLVKYEFEATVTEIADPLELFPSIRLGDAASGTVTYDPLKTYDLSEPNVAQFYINPSWFQSATLVIQSSNGVDTVFLPDSQGAFPFNATMVNDLEEDDAFEETDGIAFFQTVIAPAGFASETPGISVNFLAPGTKSDALDDTLPDELVLDDWPFVAVSFFDLFLADDSATQLVATIHTLRAAEVGPGDFNGSGGVDSADLSIWKDDVGIASPGDPLPLLPYADADGDGDSDGNDFLVWQRNLSGSAIATTIPEPSGVLLTICMFVIGGSGQRVGDKRRLFNYRRSNLAYPAVAGTRGDERVMTTIP